MNTRTLRYAAVVTAAACLLFLPPSSRAETAPEDRVSGAEVRKELRDAADVIRRYAADQRQEALKKAAELLNDLDRRIEQLEKDLDEKWERMSTVSRQKARETLKALRRQRTELAEWYGGLQHSSDSAWEQMKKGFSDAYSDLAEAWKRAGKEFDREE